MPVRKQLVVVKEKIKKKGTHRNTWKVAERKVATNFGTKRTPLSGSNSGHNTNSDSLHEHLYIETKYRLKHAAVALYNDTKAKAKAEKKIPIVALKQKGETGYLILIDPKHLIEIAKHYVTKQQSGEASNDSQS